jgi:hypothetical protein
MRGPISFEMVKAMGQAAGFDFDLERCKILQPQMEALLKDAELLETTGRSEDDMALIFHFGYHNLHNCRKPG